MSEGPTVILCGPQPGSTCFCTHAAEDHHLAECKKCGCDQFIDERTLW